MSGKKQISILSFAQRGKPTKKARLGPEKVVNTLEEEMVEEEETVQVEEEETVQVEEEMVQPIRVRQIERGRWRRVVPHGETKRLKDRGPIGPPRATALTGVGRRNTAKR